MNLKKLYKPDKAFLERTRHAYLLRYHERFPHPVRVVSGFGYFIRGAAVGASFVFVISGVAAYADGQNVGPTNLLYPLKRTYESVDLLLANESRKPELHVQFAERRLSEIQEIKQEKPKSSKIQNLTADFEKEIQRTLSVFEAPTSRVSEQDSSMPETLPSAAGTAKPKQESKTFREDRPSLEQNFNVTTFGKPTSSQKRQVSPASPQGITVESSSPVKDQKMFLPAIPIQGIAPVCGSLGAFLNRRGEEVRKILNDGKELFEKYQENCERRAEGSDGETEQESDNGKSLPGTLLNKIEQGN